jgi:hypothetical protein
MSAPVVSSPLILDLIGANERMRDTLVMVMRGPAHDIARLAERDEAQAVIVNLDGASAMTEWARYRERFPNRPAIALALTNDPVQHAIAVVAKPVKIEAFVAAVRKVREAVAQQPAALPARMPAPTRSELSAALSRSVPADTHAPSRSLSMSQRSVSLSSRRPPALEALCGTRADIDPADGAQIAALKFSTAGYLLAHLRDATARSQEAGAPYALLQGGRPVAMVMARQDRALTLVPEVVIEALCAHPQPDIRMGAAPSASGGVSDPVARHGKSIALDALLWNVAVWTYRGRLPEDAPLAERVYLRCWPNLTRMLMLPNAVRICALLTQHPMRLVDIAHALRIPQRHVFALYAAASTIGLAGVAKRDSDYLFDLQPRNPAQREVIYRLAKRLASVAPVTQS